MGGRWAASKEMYFSYIRYHEAFYQDGVTIETGIATPDAHRRVVSFSGDQ